MLFKTFQGLLSQGATPLDGSSVASGGLSGALSQLYQEYLRAQSVYDAFTALFGDPVWINSQTGPAFSNWIANFVKDATGSDGHAQALSDASIASLESITAPEGVSAAAVATFLARWNRTATYYAEGIYNSTDVPAGMSTNFIAMDVFNAKNQTAIDNLQLDAAQGFTTFGEGLDYAANQMYADLKLMMGSGTICATVGLQVDQTAVVTRQAFDATLTLDNGDMMPLTNVGLKVIVRDANGNDVTNLFTIQGPTLNGLTAVDGTGMLAMNTSGTATFTLIPDDNAAPTGPEQYYVSGELDYTMDGMSLEVPFSPSTITVNPNPSLTLRYFMQRDVFGPDPSNPAAPSEPFALGVQILNIGAGTANSVELTSAQPKIIDNEKGLLVNFQIIGTQVDGQNLNPSLTANFGDIAPGGVSEGYFLLESSIQGQFIDFSASYKDLSGLGSTQASIINGIQIYELTHLAAPIGANSGSTAFLVDTIPNPLGTPDTIFLPDGSSAPVAQAANASFDASPGPGHLAVHLTDTAISGWSYLVVTDPGHGSYRLVSVTRSDGVSLPANDFYQTDRVFIGGGREPIYENDLHILDDNGTGSYTLVYAPVDTTPPVITSLAQVIPNPTGTPVDNLQVTFSKPIDLSTFNYQDLTLTRNGGPNLITSAASVTLVSGSTYQIGGLSTLDAADGSYLLTVNDNAIADPLGNLGTGTAQTSWVEAKVGPAVSSIIGVIPGPRNLPVPAVVVTFTKPIQPSSFTLSAVSLTLNGGPNLLANAPGVTLVQDSSTAFTINGLSSLTTANGNYVLAVDASNVLDLSNDPGAGTSVVAFTMDTTAPTIVAIAPVPTPRNAAATSVSVTFSKAIDTNTLIPALSLSLNGGPNLITSGNVTISVLPGNIYQVNGLAALTGSNGSYTFSVNATTLQDLAGNSGQGSSSITFVVNTMLPAAPANLAITPNTGVMPANNLTNTTSLTLTGSLNEAGLTVHVVDTTTNTDLGEQVETGTTFSFPIAFSTTGAHTLSVTAIDGVGNVSPASNLSLSIDTTPPTVTSLSAVSSPRNTPVSPLVLTFSKPIDPTTLDWHAFSLSLDGGPNLITAAVSVTLVSGNTYQINGLGNLTGSDGSYVLSIKPSVVRDLAGNPLTAPASASWLIDTTLPTSSDSPLPSTEPSLSFLVSATGKDPSPGPGVPPSGVASFELYVSVDSGPFMPWTSVSAANPAALYTAQGGHAYAFASLAVDLAGNVESKALTPDTGTYVPFLAPAITAVTGVGSVPGPPYATLRLALSGTDAGGNGLASFNVYVQIDDATTLTLIGTVPAGSPVNGVYSGTFSFQPIADNASHTYTFTIIGVDSRNIVEKKSGGDLTVQYTFAPPATVQAEGLTVQGGAVERSFLRYVDVNFNQTDAQSGGLLTSLIASLSTNDPMIELIHHDLGYSNQPGSTDTAGTVVPLSASMLRVVDHAIEIDFGQFGLGGVSPVGLSLGDYWNAMIQGDGYYEIDLNPNPADTGGDFPIREYFDRLLGDVTGDGLVDGDLTNPISDASLIKAAQNQTGAVAIPYDVNGDGSVNTVDYFLVTRSKNRKVSGGVNLNG